MTGRDRVFSRPYRVSDRDACLAIFDGNLPKFFAPEERHQFASHLDGLDAVRGPYLVLIHGKVVVACGGLWIDLDQRRASLSWGMVDRRLHGKGLGSRLLEARLELARAIPQIDELILTTSQHTGGFYERFGFETVRVVPDGLAAGLDQWDMRLGLRD